MYTDTIIKFIICGVFVGVVVFMTTYHIRWRWSQNVGGWLIMGMASCLLSSAILSEVGSFWPEWRYRPYLRIAGWGFIFIIVLIASVSMLLIKRPKDDD